MPNVKGKEFPYSKEGIKAAKEYAESDAMERSDKYQWGGMVLPREPLQGGTRPTPFNPPERPNLPTYKKGGKVKK